MKQVLPWLAGCRALVLVSLVVFGGPSFHIKKIMDRMVAVGDARYRARWGEVVKGMGSDGLYYCMVGSGDHPSQEEQSAFLFFHQENRQILNAKGQGFLLLARPGREELQQVMEELAHAQ